MSGDKLTVRNMSKSFRTDTGEAVNAVDDVSFALAENEFVSLLGPSGCGKSTLLSIAAGLTEPTSGAVLVDDEIVRGPGRDRGVVFQTYTLFPWMNVAANIEFALRGERYSRAERRRVAQEHLELVGLSSFADAMPSQLSGGMRQRVAIARALSYRPRVLLMDEPFGALDALTRQHMQELLTQVWEAHRLTVLFVTHDIDEAIFLSDRVLLMSARPGRLIEDFRIDLDRPRQFEAQASAQFVDYRTYLMSAIREAQEISGGVA